MYVGESNSFVQKITSQGEGQCTALPWRFLLVLLNICSQNQANSQLNLGATRVLKNCQSIILTLNNMRILLQLVCAFMGNPVGCHQTTPF